MRTKHLEYLIDLFNTKSYSKTAENFFTTRQSISNGVKMLEEEYNVKILNRTYKGVDFTDEGVIFYKYALEMTETDRRLKQELIPYTVKDKYNLQGELDIYITSRFSNKNFLRFYSSYEKANKKIKLNLKTVSPSWFFKRAAFDTPLLYLIPTSKKTLEDVAFLNLIKQHNISLRVIKKYTLGLCVAQQSKWKQILSDLAPSDLLNNNLNIPVAAFNYAVDDILSESLIDNGHLPRNQFITVDDFESQKLLLKKDACVVLATFNEYEMFFRSKDNSISFLSNSHIHEPNFYYCAIFSKENSTQNIIEDFIENFKKAYC